MTDTARTDDAAIVADRSRGCQAGRAFVQTESLPFIDIVRLLRSPWLAPDVWMLRRTKLFVMGVAVIAGQLAAAWPRRLNFPVRVSAACNAIVGGGEVVIRPGVLGFEMSVGSGHAGHPPQAIRTAGVIALHFPLASARVSAGLRPRQSDSTGNWWR